jgi:phage-related protein
MTGLLLGAFGTVIITTFTTFIATVFAIGAAVVWLIEHVKAIINWFKNLGNGVTETGGFFDRGKQYIADFVGKFAWAFQMLDAIWGFIVSLVKLGFTAVHFLFAWGLEIVQSAWETTWAMVGDTVKATWSFVFDFVKSIWDKIVSLATSQGETIRNVFTSVRDAVFDVMRSIFDFVKNILSDIGNWMYDSGRSIISGLINGITSRFNEARGVIEDITGWIKDHFPHSPAKIGPLSGSGGMFYAGQNIVKQLAQGIESARSMLRAPTAGVSLNARNSILAAPGPTGSNKQVNQNIVVHTQEINPVRQSAELGWLLAGRS